MIRRFALSIALIVALVSACIASAPAQPAHAARVAHPVASSAALFDKTRVLAHLALGWGAFHRYVYKPYKAHDLTTSHPLKLIKAGAALLFTAHEVKVAYGIAKGSNSDTLKALAGVLKGLGDKFATIGNKFKSTVGLSNADVNTAVSGLNGAVDNSNKVLNVPDASVIPGL